MARRSLGSRRCTSRDRHTRSRAAATRCWCPGSIGNSSLPPPFTQLDWEQLDDWLTANDDFFVVFHYDIPKLDASWRLGITGLVARPQSLSLADLAARQRREQTVTLECSGDHGFPDFTGAVSNARWAGTPLAPLLHAAGLDRKATEVVFYGADSGPVMIRDNPGVVRPPSHRTTERRTRPIPAGST